MRQHAPDEKSGLVVPCFNEEKRWNFQYWDKLIRQCQLTSFLFVDDGSNDQTLSIIMSYQKYNNVSILSLQQNSGKSEAVRQGFLSSMKAEQSLKIIGFMDADSAISIDDIIEFQTNIIPRHIKSYDAFWGSRVMLLGRNINRRNLRHYASRVLITIFNIFTNLHVYDSQAGLKFFKVNTEFMKILEKTFKTRWLFEIEILFRYNQFTGNKLKVWEEPLLNWTDISESKINFREMVRILNEILIILRLGRYQ